MKALIPYDMDEPTVLDLLKRHCWFKRGTKWHLCTSLANYMQHFPSGKELRRRKGVAYFSFCGNKLHVASRLRNQREFHDALTAPEGEICPICLAFYRGLKYSRDKFIKRNKTFKQIEAAKLGNSEDVAWYSL